MESRRRVYVEDARAFIRVSRVTFTLRPNIVESNWIFQFTDFLVSPRLLCLYIYDFIPGPSITFSALTLLKLELYLYDVGPHAFRDLLVFIVSSHPWRTLR